MTIRTDNLIGGGWVRSDSGREFDVLDPATDEVIASVPLCGRSEAGRAVDAAASALPSWRATTPADRGALVAALGRAMLEDIETLAGLITGECGKPLTEARGEVGYAAGFLEWAGAEGPRVMGEVILASASDRRIVTLRQPVGVCALITPWNFPAAMITRKLGPALACGCPVVIKPAELAPLTALHIASLAERVGIPAGVMNVITGDAAEIGGGLTGDARVRKISFTGSTEVGRLLMRESAATLKRLSLELGGHAPALVFEDADLDLAADQIMVSKFRNAGQTCICINRVLAHESVHDALAERLVERVRALKVGRGSEEGVEIGPLISDRGVEKVERHLADARASGAAVLVGGGRVAVPGCADRFIEACVLTGLTPGMLMWREETFGPVLGLASFSDEAQAIEMANDTDYGLASYLFTRDLSRSWRVSEALDFGIVGVNDGAPSTPQAPFGGIKQSGFGREGGHHAMDEYLDVKYVSMRVGDEG